MTVVFRYGSVLILRLDLDVRPRFFGAPQFLGPRSTPPHVHPHTLAGSPPRPREHEPSPLVLPGRIRLDRPRERLKLTPCPHCHVVGTLNRHGSLSGYDESNPQRKTLRARRIFCSNRHRRPGCGRTFSIELAETIRRSSLTTRTLLAFLTQAVSLGIAAAIRAVKCHLSHRTLQRFWKRFDHAQSRIRTALLGRGPPPEGAFKDFRRPAAAQVLAHLHATFPNTDCPIAAYQMATRSFFL